MTFVFSRYGRHSSQEVPELGPDEVEICATLGDGEPSHHPAGLIKLWREGRFCDACVEVGGRQYPVHRCVLAPSSKFFETAFESHFSESTSALVRLELPAAAWEAASEFAYTGRCVLDASSLIPMLEAANFLEMATLEARLVDAIAARATPDNLHDAWAAASRLSLPALEKRLCLGVASSADSIAAFASAAGAEQLPTAVRAAIADAHHHRRKCVRVRLPNDGTGWEEQLASVRAHFARLGGVDGVAFSIDKQSIVELRFEAAAETCGGCTNFDMSCEQLESFVAAGVTVTLPQPALSVGSPGHSRPRVMNPMMHPSKHAWFLRSAVVADSEVFSVASVAVAKGYPRPVRAAPKGPTLLHYRIEVDVGLSFDAASALLERARARAAPFPVQIAVWEPQSAMGFYRADAPLGGRDGLFGYALLLCAGAEHVDERTGAPLYVVCTPGEGRTRRRVTHSDFVRQYSLIDDARAGWERHYADAAHHCVHGPSCTASAAHCRARKRTRGGWTACRAREDGAVAAEGTSCLRGKRIRTIDLITGDALVPLWSVLEPRAILTVELGEHPLVSGRTTQLTGVWVDAENVPADAAGAAEPPVPPAAGPAEQADDCASSSCAEA